MKKIIDIPRPQTWDEWITEWEQRTHLADLLILLDEGFVCAQTTDKVQEYFELLLQLAEENCVGLCSSISPKAILGNRAFEILSKTKFKNVYGLQLLFYKPEVLDATIHFFRPANGKTKWRGLQNLYSCEEAEIARVFAEKLCLFIFYGLDDTQQKAGNRKTVELILARKPEAIKILHALGKLHRLLPRNSTDWDKFDKETMAALGKLARKDLGNEATDLKGEEMIKFARSIGSQAAILYLAVRSHQEYTRER